MPRISPDQRTARRQEILDAARACFAEYGYDGATIAKLETATGLSRGAIFHYFDDKEELFLALADDDAGRLAALWLEGGFEQLLRALVDEDPSWLGVYLELGRRLRTDEKFHARWLERAPAFEHRLEQRLSQLQDAGELRSDVDPATLRRFMGIIADGLTLRRATGLESGSDELIRLAVDATRTSR